MLLLLLLSLQFFLCLLDLLRLLELLLELLALEESSFSGSSEKAGFVFFAGILLGTSVLQKLVTDRLFDCLAEDARDLDEVAQPQFWVHLGVFTIIFDQFRVEAFALVDTEWPILAPNRRFFDLNPSNQQRFHNFLFQTEAASNAFVLTFLPEFFLVVLRKLRETRWRPRAEQSSELRPFHVAFGATPTPSAFAAQPATDWVGLCFAAVADDPWTHG